MQRFNLLELIIGLLLLISVFLTWVAPSAALGPQLGGDSGRDVSDIIGHMGIFGGLIVMGITFLPLSMLRRVLQIIIGLGALGLLGYMVISGVLPILNEYTRNLMVIREGFYLYGLVAIALIFIGFLHRH